MTNALKYSPADIPVEVALACDAGGIEISVSDHGPGIAPEDHAVIFQPFVRGSGAGHCEGFGLGLAIAHRAVAAQGGSIVLASIPGQGSTFTVRLPAA